MIFDVDDIYEIEECYKTKLKEKDKEIERLNNIINKAIEYLEKCQLGVDGRDRPVMLKDQEEGQELLEILDKVEENK